MDSLLDLMAYSLSSFTFNFNICFHVHIITKKPAVPQSHLCAEFLIIFINSKFHFYAILAPKMLDFYSLLESFPKISLL